MFQLEFVGRKWRIELRVRDEAVALQVLNGGLAEEALLSLLQ